MVLRLLNKNKGDITMASDSGNQNANSHIAGQKSLEDQNSENARQVQVFDRNDFTTTIVSRPSVSNGPTYLTPNNYSNETSKKPNTVKTRYNCASLGTSTSHDFTSQRAYTSEFNSTPEMSRDSFWKMRLKPTTSESAQKLISNKYKKRGLSLRHGYPQKQIEKPHDFIKSHFSRHSWCGGNFKNYISLRNHSPVPSKVNFSSGNSENWQAPFKLSWLKSKDSPKSAEGEITVQVDVHRTASGEPVVVKKCDQRRLPKRKERMCQSDDVDMILDFTEIPEVMKYPIRQNADRPPITSNEKLYNANGKFCQLWLNIADFTSFCDICFRCISPILLTSFLCILVSGLLTLILVFIWIVGKIAFAL